MVYKVCILTAGLGTRVRDVFSLSNKALMPINGKAAISHIISTIDPEVEIVVAVGHKAEDVIEYIQHAHPQRHIEFVTISKFEGAGTGPGSSIYECRTRLDCPFIIWTVDTLLTSGKMPTVSCEDTDWVGVSVVPDVARFCKVLTNKDMIVGYEDKCSAGPGQVFVGMAGVKNHEKFFKVLGQAVSNTEKSPQISDGLMALYAARVQIDDWCDVGVSEEFADKNMFNFSKPDEATYDVDGRIIKLYADAERVTSKAHRHALLSQVCPSELSIGKHVLSYPKVAGSTVYDQLDIGLSNKICEWATKELWTHKELDDCDEFYQACLEMYKHKTISRLDTIITRHPNLLHGKCNINGITVDSYDELLSRIDWDNFSKCGIPAVIHGDLQFDNVIVAETTRELVAIDWRESFGGLDYGDVYYDLGKLLGGMTMSYGAVKRNAFSFEYTDDGCRFDAETSLVLNECRHEFYKFLANAGYDSKRVEVIRALVFAGMSAMHYNPFDELLFYAGRYYLQQALDQ